MSALIKGSQLRTAMRPIVLATDYGPTGAYVGQLKSAIYSIAPEAKVIDLVHELPAMNPRASAYVLASLLEHIPEQSVVVGVVDPGVGSDRAPVVLEGDGYTFTGPDNGLFSIVSRKLSEIGLFEILLSKEPISKTFHGRDIFAPVAAQIVSGSRPDLKPVPVTVLDGTEWPDSLNEVIHIDHFGNGLTGILFHSSSINQVLRVNGQGIRYAEAFYCVHKGEGFWYCNSNNLVEIAVNGGSAAEKFQLSIGDKIILN